MVFVGVRYGPGSAFQIIVLRYGKYCLTKQSSTFQGYVRASNHLMPSILFQSTVTDGVSTGHLTPPSVAGHVASTKLSSTGRINSLTGHRFVDAVSGRDIFRRKRGVVLYMPCVFLSLLSAPMVGLAVNTLSASQPTKHTIRELCNINHSNSTLVCCR